MAAATTRKSTLMKFERLILAIANAVGRKKERSVIGALRAKAVLSLGGLGVGVGIQGGM